jgi:hypothetical protein
VRADHLPFGNRVWVFAPNDPTGARVQEIAAPT